MLESWMFIWYLSQIVVMAHLVLFISIKCSRKFYNSNDGGSKRLGGSVEGGSFRESVGVYGEYMLY